MSCLSSPTFSSISSPVNNLPRLLPVSGKALLGLFLTLASYSFPFTNSTHPWGKGKQSLWVIFCHLLVIRGTLVPYSTQRHASLGLFACFLLNTKRFNLISSVGIRAASLNTALTAAVWVIVMRVLSYHCFPLCPCNCQNIASGFLCQKKSSFAREGQGMKFST